MDPALAAWLCSEAARPALTRAAALEGLAPHRRPAALADLGTPEQVRAALGLAGLRLRARAKTPHADRLFFTPESLEQATPWEVAQERAGRWPLGPGARVVDLGAGAGLAALALASAGRPVLALERDPVRLRFLRANVAALALDDLVEPRGADAREGPFGASGAFLDPDRRPGGRRRRDPEAFEPARSTWSGLLASYAAAVVKAPPVELPGLAGEAPFEVVSLRGEVKERRLWWRGFAGAPPRRALALPGGAAVEGPGEPWPEPRAPEPGLWLFDPDPAVTVAGLVGDLARRDALRPVHPRIAYLVAERPVAASPGTWLRVEARLPAREPALTAWLRAREVGRLELRSRGVEQDAGRWRSRLRPRGPGAATLVFTRDPDDRWTVLACRPPEPRT